jgi:hypothetical protein
MRESEKRFSSLNKWSLCIVVAVLYAVILAITLLTHQPQEITTQVLEYGASGVGMLIFIILVFA